VLFPDVDCHFSPSRDQSGTARAGATLPRLVLNLHTPFYRCSWVLAGKLVPEQIDGPD
jgi:hypothetical protein